MVAREPFFVLESAVNPWRNMDWRKPHPEVRHPCVHPCSPSPVTHSLHRKSFIDDNHIYLIILVNTVDDEIERPETTRPRGRPRVSRKFEQNGPVRCYAPQCHVQGREEMVLLLPEELELLKLVDLQGLEQEEAAAALGVSRRTVWRDLHEARRKVADALIHGKAIEVSGCTLRTEGRCPRLADSLCPKEKGGTCPKRWQKSDIPRE